ncbi:putative O-linked N-acetylglucosamine transferase, SPINDLY family [Synechococcus sp. PCC 7502]|uniref:tetratricopeptide repeat protein n=1 Tax=Synechococcus sp. PCC 7502 TaxID=1173263 RepID=UPI00029FD9F1|nr:tetratricopeptide repeat protein [Synechococcus sp. PCC 7502]AFY73828.1 putative O-linked N-acetylglucosamine transferase, SPINDLY family [Synechococcus sp. PCC 7502]
MPTLSIELAFKYHQAGDLAEAERLYRQILIQQPHHIDANHLLGVLAHQVGNYDVAIAYIETAIKLNPRNPDFYGNLGEAYRLSGKFTEAIASFQKALKLQPHNGKTHYNLGNALQAQGNLEQAISHYQRAIDLIPNLAQAHHNLGFLLKAQGDTTKAIAAYRQALAINPNYLQALHSLGNALQESGLILEALDIYMKALELSPQSAEIYNDLGNALQANYDFDRAIVVYHKAIELKADFAEAYYNLGNAYTVRARAEEAEFSYRQALLIKHDRADWYITLGTLLKDQNKIPEAIATFQTALMYKPDCLEARLKIWLLLPIIYETTAQVSQWRTRFIEGLNQLIKSVPLDTPIQISEAVKAIQNSTNFYLAYQAQNDLELQTQYGDLVHRIMIAAYPQYAQINPNRPKSTKIRLGFISNYFRNHTVGKLFLGWLQSCDHQQFEIYCYYTGKLPTPATDAFAAVSDFIYHLPRLDTVIDQIAQDQLDILVFTDIGMHPETTQVAALRLAPVQCLAWGHPVTSGLPTIDYFLSSDLMEPEGAEAHYREQLIRLPNLSIAYARPESPQYLLERSQFQISEDAIVYLCCQSLYKYLPKYDYIFAAIAKRVPKAKFAFIYSNNGDYVTRQFKQRLDIAFARQNQNSEEHCLIMPRLNRDEYLSLNRIADIFLDTIDWSGGNTTLEAISCNLPVVTLPTQFMRGRHSYAMLQMLEVTETIASSESEYIDIAVKLGLDHPWRASIVEKIKNNSDRLYNDQVCIKALEKFWKNPHSYVSGEA